MKPIFFSKVPQKLSDRGQRAMFCGGPFDMLSQTTSGCDWVAFPRVDSTKTASDRRIYFAATGDKVSTDPLMLASLGVVETG
jgi:hypothetical protein